MLDDIQRSLDKLRDRPRDTSALTLLGDALSAANGLTPQVVQLLDRSRAHHGETGNWDLVVGLIDLELSRVDDGERRAALLRQKAQVLESELLDEEGALAAFREVLELRPDDQGVKQTVDQIVLVRENWQRIASKYVEEAESATDRQLSTGLFLSAAELYWRNEQESDRVEPYLRRALDVEPRNRKASAHLERLLRRQQRSKELVDLLEQRAAVAANREERVGCFLAAGEVCAVELGDRDAAAEYYRRALSVDPGSSRVLSQLVEHFTGNEDWATLVRVYEDALRAIPGGEGEAGMLLQIGMLHAHKLDDWDRAEEYFRRVRKADPAQPVMLEFYREHYKRAGREVRILALLDAAQRSSSDPRQRLTIAIEMAEMAEHELGNIDKAIDGWKNVLRLAEGSEDRRRAESALKRLYRAADPPKWNALRELLKDEIDALGPEDAEQKVRLLQEVVEIYRDHLKLDVMVINTYNAILQVQPENEQASDALIETYEAMGRWNELIAVLQRRAEVDEDVDRRVAMWHRIADLWEGKFGNLGQAVAPLEAALDAKPDDQPSLDRLRDIYTKRRSWRGLIGLKEREALQASGGERIAALREMAQLTAEHLGDAAETIEVYNRILAEDSADPDALEQLSELYGREGRWPALAEVLHRRLEAEPSRAELLERLAELYTNQMRAVDRAVAVWRQVLALRPEHPKAKAVLRELYVQQRRWDDLQQLLGGTEQFGELAEALTSAADRSDDMGLKVQLYQQVGDLYRDRLEDPERAIRAYERVLAVDPDNVEAARALAPLYRDGEKWGRLVATYEGLVEHAGDLDEQLDLLADIRDIYENRLESNQLAFAACVRAFSLDPRNGALRGELERLARACSAWSELMRVYREQVTVTEDPEAKAVLLERMAKIVLHELSRREEAEGILRQLSDLRPKDLGALGALERLYQEDQRWSELVDVLRKRVALIAGNEEKVDLALRIATLQEERLGDPEGAIDTCTLALSLEARNVRALMMLERLYRVRAEWGRLPDVLLRLVGLLEDGSEKAAVLGRLGQHFAEQTEEPRKAIDAYASALELDPTCESAVAGLEQQLSGSGEDRVRAAELLRPFYEQAQAWPQLREVIEILLDGATAAQSRLALLKRLREVCERELGDAQSAFSAALELLELDPADADNWHGLGPIAERVGRLPELASRLKTALERVEPGNEKLERALLAELIVTYEERLGEQEAAEPHLRRLLELDPDNQHAWVTRERLLRDGGRWTELREHLEQWHDAADEPDQRKKLLLQICSLNEDVLGETEAAITAYERVLALDTENEVALRALERHYRAAGRWEALSRLLTRQIGLAADESAANEIRVREAAVRAHYLDDVDGAVSLLEEVLASHPTEGSVALLEEFLELEAVRARVAALLESAYGVTENWPRLVGILRLRRTLVDDRLEQVGLLQRAAELQRTRLDDAHAAMNTLLDALVLAPGNEAIHVEVESLAASLHQWDALAGGWRAAAEAAAEDDLPLRSTLLTKLGLVQRDRLQDLEGAQRTFERLLQLAPENPEVAGPASEALAGIYEAAGRWEALTGALDRQLAWAEERQTRRALLGRIGALREQLAQTEQAIEAYRALLDEDGGPAALDPLERLYLQTEQWHELIGVFRLRLDLAQGDEERRVHFGRIAEVYQQELGEPDEAIATYLALLDEQPDGSETLSALAGLYRSAERWPDLLEMIERQIPAASGERRVSLLHEAARLQQHELGDPGLAIERYRELLAEDPDHQATREALEELMDDAAYSPAVAAVLLDLYRGQENWWALLRILEQHAAEVEPAQQAQLYSEAGRVAELRLSDAGRAFELYGQALTADAGADQVVTALERLAESLGRWAELADTIARAAPTLADAEARKALHLRAAVLCRDKLGDLERARGHFESAIEIDPAQAEALAALEAIYRDQHEWSRLLEVLDRRAEQAASAELAIPLLLEAGGLCREQLERRADAIGYFERLLALADDAVAAQAAEALDALYQAERRWPDLNQHLGKLAEAATGEQRVALLVRLGQLRLERLSDDGGALEAFREVLRVDPEQAEALRASEKLLERPELALETADVLEPIYLAQQQWARLLRIFELRIDAAESEEQRFELSLKAARICEEQLEDLPRAFEWYSRVVRARPGDGQLRDQLLRLAGVLGRWSDLAELLSQALDELEGAEARSVALSLGTIYDEELLQCDPARRCYEQLLTADRSDEEAFGRMERLLTRYEQWDDLLDLYRDATDATADPARQRELLLRICRVWEEALDKPHEAIDAYRAVLELDDQDHEALEGLERLFADTEQWEDLCELLDRRASAKEDPAEIVAQRLRLGSIAAERLDDAPRAIDQYEEVLRLDPANGRAVGALEQLVLDRELRPRIAQILQEVYKAQDEWAKLVVIYDAQLEFTQDPERRIELLCEIARLHEERDGHVELAARALSRAFELDPVRMEVLDQIERLAGKLGNWANVASLLERALAEVYDDWVVARLNARLARLREQRLDDPSGAVDAWQRALAVSPNDQPVIEELSRLLTQLERWDALVEVLVGQAEASDDAEVRMRSYRRAAEAFQAHINDARRAIDCWRQVLEIADARGADAESNDALEALERLLEIAGDWAELVAVKRRRLELVPEGDARRALRWQIARVLMEQLEDNFEAIGVLKTLLQGDQRDPEVLEALDRLYSRERAWSDLLEIIELKATRETSEEQSTALEFRAGAILANEIGDLASAVDRFENVLRTRPDHRPALEALERILGEEGHRERVANILEGLYEAAGETESLVRVLRARLQGLAVPAEIAAVWRRIAALSEKQLQEPARAFSALLEAFAADAADAEVRAELDRLAEQLSRVPDLARAYEQRIDSIYDNELACLLNMKLGRLFEQVLADDAQAEARYRAALDCGGEQREPLLALEQLLTRQLDAGHQKAEHLLEIVERLVDVVERPEEQASLYAKIAELRQTHRSDPEGALVAWRESLGRDPSHAAALEGLESLLASEVHRAAALDLLEPHYEEQGDFAKLTRLLESRLTTLSTPAERAQLLARIARVHEEKLDARDQALGAYGRALTEDPSDPAIVAQVERLAGDLARWAELVAVAEEVLTREMDADAARDLGLRVGSWCREKLDDADRAEVIYCKVLELAPGAQDALVALEQLYRDGGRTRELAGVLWQRAEAEYDGTRRRELLAQVAELCESEDPSRAIEAWRAVLDLDEGDAPALAALVALYEQTAQWEQLLEALEQQAGLASAPAERLEVKRRAAVILATRLRDEERTIEAYRDILDLDPVDSDALSTLERIYSSREDWSSVQEILVRRLALYEGAAAIPLYYQLCELAQDKTGELEQARIYLQRILELDPKDRAAATRLETLLAQAGEWYDLIELLRNKSERLRADGDSAAALECQLQVARVWSEKLDNPDAAAEVLERLLESGEGRGQVLVELARLYEIGKQFDRCRDTLQQLLTLDELPPRQAADAAFRMGRVTRELGGDTANVITAYERALDLDPGHAEASIALEQLAQEGEDWGRVAQVLERRVEQLEGEERFVVLARLGRLYGRELARVEQAVSAWERAREIKPEDPEALGELAEGYYEQGRLAMAAPILVALIERAGGRRTKQAAGYHYRLGVISEDQDDPKAAFEHFERAYRADSTSTPTLVALGRLYFERQDWEAARKIYRSMLLQNIDAESGITRADIFFNLGRVHLGLGEKGKALSMFERGLEAEPEHAALQAALDDLKH